MRSAKILITGCEGQLGRDLVRELGSDYEITGIDLPENDICDKTALKRSIETIKPAIVIHTAAYTEVDGCEADPDLAMSVNGEGTCNVAQACQTIGARLIYYSTDYVFDGKNKSPYLETDSPDPQTVYGRSKLAGEEAVRSILDDYLIMRIAWVYGEHGKNFVKTMLRLGQEQLAAKTAGQTVKPLMVVDDQRGNPTWTIDIVNQTKALLEADVRGIVHSTSEGETNWFGFASAIFELANMAVDLVPCDSSQFPRPAKRPANSSLENARLKELGCHRMRPYLDSLEEFIRQNKD